jgi:hypothetical protein
MGVTKKHKINFVIQGPSWSMNCYDMTLEEFIAAVRKLDDGQVVEFDIDTTYEDDWGL